MRLFILALLVLSISCGKSKDKDSKTRDQLPTTPSDPTEEFSMPEGLYSSACLIANGDDETDPAGRYSRKFRIEYKDGKFISWHTYFKDKICNAPYYKFWTTYTVDSLRKAKESQEVLINLTVDAIEYQWSHPWYVSQKYCGITDWVIFEKKDISGVDCPDFTDREDGYMRAKGQKVFISARLDEEGEAINFPWGRDDLGDSKEARYSSEENPSFTLSFPVAPAIIP